MNCDIPCAARSPRFPSRSRAPFRRHWPLLGLLACAGLLASQADSWPDVAPWAAPDLSSRAADADISLQPAAGQGDGLRGDGRDTRCESGVSGELGRKAETPLYHTIWPATTPSDAAPIQPSKCRYGSGRRIWM